MNAPAGTKNGKKSCNVTNSLVMGSGGGGGGAYGEKESLINMSVNKSMGGNMYWKKRKSYFMNVFYWSLYL